MRYQTFVWMVWAILALMGAGFVWMLCTVLHG